MKFEGVEIHIGQTDTAEGGIIVMLYRKYAQYITSEEEEEDTEIPFIRTYYWAMPK